MIYLFYLYAKKLTLILDTSTITTTKTTNYVKISYRGENFFSSFDYTNLRIANDKRQRNEMIKKNNFFFFRNFDD